MDPKTPWQKSSVTMSTKDRCLKPSSFIGDPRSTRAIGFSINLVAAVPIS